MITETQFQNILEEVKREEGIEYSIKASPESSSLYARIDYGEAYRIIRISDHKPPRDSKVEMLDAIVHPNPSYKYVKTFVSSKARKLKRSNLSKLFKKIEGKP